MKKEAIIILMFISMIGSVIAAPSLPHTFIGKVEYSKAPLTNLKGYDISASISGYGLGIVGFVDEGNNYEVSVDTQGRTGIITFYIGGAEAKPTASYVWGGHNENFNLEINTLPLNSICGNDIKEPGEQCDGNQFGTGTCENVLGISGATGNLSCTEICTFDYGNCTAPYCGDGICNSALGEACSTCSQDCGACSSGSGSGGGGGGGGGGSSSTSGTTTTSSKITIPTVTTSGNCEEKWICANWSDSKNSCGIRTCEDENKCGTIVNKPETEKNCLSKTSSGITGAVIGGTVNFAKSKAGMSAIFVVLIVGAVMLIARSRKKQISNEMVQGEIAKIEPK